MNTFTSHNARLVDKPRTFSDKQGNPRVSIRVVDSPLSKKRDDIKSFFIDVTVPAGLTDRFGALNKGDVVMVEGQLQQRTYTSKAGKEGVSFEIPFPSSLLILTQKEEPAADPWVGPPVTAALNGDVEEDLFGDQE